MKKTIVLAGLLALPVIGSAQASATVDLRLNLPVVMPQLVVVSPGVQVVPEVEEEVFFVDGYYWCRHDGGWYRARTVRGGWRPMPVRAVPVALVRVPPGHYRHWKAERAAERREWREERREGRREERREERRHEEHERRHEDHDRGHGRGHGHD